MKGRVLVVDDDPSLGEMLGIVLRQEGFEPVFVRSGDQAIAAFHQAKPDLVLLDLMLPGKDGLEICRELRLESGVPIVMLTAKTDTVDVVLGLESGATTTSPSRSRPRSWWPDPGPAAPPRHRQGRDPALPRHRDGRHGPPGHQGWQAGQPDPAGVRAAGHPGQAPRQVFTREVLLEQVWGYRYAGDTRLVNVHVQRLRAKIEDDPENPGWCRL